MKTETSRHTPASRIAVTLGWLLIIGGLFSIFCMIRVIQQKKVEGPAPQAIEQPRIEEFKNENQTVSVPINKNKRKSKPVRVRQHKKAISEYRFADGIAMPDRN
jgi:hypothetical protein